MQAFCQIVNGDDFGWIIYTGMENIFGDKTENGRYFTNLLTYIFVNYPFVRICSFSLLLFALFIILARLISSGVNAENIDKAKIDMIKLPYLSYAASDTAYFWYNDTEDDSLLESDDGTTEFYMNAIKKYHHIEGIDEKTVVLISVYDFNLSEDIGELERRS